MPLSTSPAHISNRCDDEGGLVADADESMLVSTEMGEETRGLGDVYIYMYI